MTITKAISTTDDIYPVLKLVIDGHEAHVLEPKLTLLKAGIVILLGDGDFWECRLGERYEVDGRTVLLRGATRDRKLIALVRRFVADETGDLLATKSTRSTRRHSKANLKG